MKLRPLIIDDQVRSSVARVLDHAAMHVIKLNHRSDPDSLLKVNWSPFTCTIPLGYRCVFSLEDQPVGLVRHLSISVNEYGKMPGIPAVEEIMKLFGFQKRFADCVKKLDKHDSNIDSINVLEIIK